jgi:hypothetical protein
MGHDPSTHSKHYQRWISLDDRISNLEAAIARSAITDRQDTNFRELLTYSQIYEMKPMDKKIHHN